MLVMMWVGWINCESVFAPVSLCNAVLRTGVVVLQELHSSAFCTLVHQEWVLGLSILSPLKSLLNLCVCMLLFTLYNSIGFHNLC